MERTPHSSGLAILHNNNVSAMSPRWVFLLLLLFSASGCQSLYSPATTPMPLHHRAGDVHAAGDFELGDRGRAFVSGTPLPHLTVYGSVQNADALSSFYEGGLGTYATFRESTGSPLIVEALAGWGRGAVDLRDADDSFSPLYLFLPFLCLGTTGCPSDPTSIQGTLTRQSVQLNVGAEHQVPDEPVVFSTGFGLRLSRVTLSDLDSSTSPITPRDRGYFLEPSLMGRTDIHGIGVQVSGGLTIPLRRFEQFTEYSGLTPHLGIGLYLKPRRLTGLF